MTFPGCPAILRTTCLAAVVLVGAYGHAQDRPSLAHDKAVLALWSAAATANALDIRSTETALSRGERELDPLMKPIMRLPAPVAYAEQQATVAALALLSHRLRYSRHEFLRKAFWLPLAALAVSNLGGYAHNRWLRPGPRSAELRSSGAMTHEAWAGHTSASMATGLFVLNSRGCAR